MQKFLKIALLVLCLIYNSKPKAKSRLDEITGLLVRDQMVDTKDEIV